MCQFRIRTVGEGISDGFAPGDPLSVRADGQRWGRKDSVRRWVEDGGTVDDFPNKHWAILIIDGYPADLDLVDPESEMPLQVQRTETAVVERPGVRPTRRTVGTPARLEQVERLSPLKREQTAKRQWCFFWDLFTPAEKLQLTTGMRELKISEHRAREIFGVKYDRRMSDRPDVMLPRRPTQGRGEDKPRRYGNAARDRQRRD